MSKMSLLLLVQLALVSPPRVGIVVNTRMSRQLVRAGELLRATGELAGVRLLSGVRSNVPGLVFEAMEGLVAERALVRTREFIAVLRRLGTRDGAVGLQNCDCAGHLAFRFVKVLAVLVCWIE